MSLSCIRNCPIFTFPVAAFIGFPLLSTKAIVEPMVSLSKPRGFWDYALFALVMTGALLFLFWLEASDGVGWTDATLASAAAVLFVLANVLSRRSENAKWIAQATWYAHLLAVLGGVGLLFGAIYADAYLLHRTDITSSRLWGDIALAVVMTAVMLWSLRRRPPASRQLP
jgi:hypothetical protein